MASLPELTQIILFVRYPDGKLMGASVAALRAHGYSREELLNLSIMTCAWPAGLNLRAQRSVILLHC